MLNPIPDRGQAMLVTQGYGRRFVGVDVEDEFVEYARSRVGKPMKIPSRQLVPNYGHVEYDAFMQTRQDRLGRVDSQVVPKTLHEHPRVVLPQLVFEATRH